MPNNRAQTRSSVSRRSGGGVLKSARRLFFVNFIRPAIQSAVSLNHEDVLRDSRYTDRRYVNKNHPPNAKRTVRVVKWAGQISERSRVRCDTLRRLRMKEVDGNHH